MTVAAIVMMIIAMIILWGGFAAATRFLIAHPGPFGDEEGYTGPVAPKDT